MKVELFQDGQLLQGQVFKTRSQGEEFIKDLLRRSPLSWIYDPTEDKWTCEGNTIQITDVPLTEEERVALIDAKIATVEDEISKTETELSARQAKLAGLNSNLSILQQEKGTS